MYLSAGCQPPLNQKKKKKANSGAVAMAEAAKNVRKRKVLSEDSKQRKRGENKLNARTRINIGSAFTRWHDIKDEEGCPTDADLALLLLDL